MAYMPGRISHQDVVSVFEEIDVNRDGVIEAWEFKDYLLHHIARGTQWESTKRFVDAWRMPIAFFVWILLGVLFGYFHEDFSIITALYYAITACSTGGLEVPRRHETSLAFCGIYIVVGIPLYAMSLSKAATQVMVMVVAARLEDEIREAREQATREVCCILKDFLADDEVDESEFIQFQLLRRQNPQHVTYSWLMEQRRLFEALDVDGSGSLDMQELYDWDPSIHKYIQLMRDMKFMTKRSINNAVSNIVQDQVRRQGTIFVGSPRR